MENLILIILISILPYIAEPPSLPSNPVLKMNQIQVIGSHNSYKEAMDSPILAQLMAMDTNRALALDYHHHSLTQQLDMGMRKLEIDIFHDPAGGLYSQPAGLEQIKKAGGKAKPFDKTVMQEPGFKVLHIQDIDFRTNCSTLKICLQEILEWSNQHPNHLPIAISFNTKTGAIPGRSDFVKPLPFTSGAFDSLDATILEVLPKEKIITPDIVRGEYETLEAAALAHNWPNLEDARGKFLFILDEGGTKRETYIKGHPSLSGRVMFVSMHPGRPEAAFIIFNNPIANQDSIRKLVKMGFMVRTRADANTEEARRNDYNRFIAAMASGAQFISTDYYKVDERIGTGYKVAFPGETVAICNTVLQPAGCFAGNLERRTQN